MIPTRLIVAESTAASLVPGATVSSLTPADFARWSARSDLRPTYNCVDMIVSDPTFDVGQGLITAHKLLTSQGIATVLSKVPGQDPQGLRKLALYAGFVNNRVEQSADGVQLSCKKPSYSQETVGTLV